MREALDDDEEARLLEQLEASSALEAVRYAEDVDRLVELSALSRRLFGADGVERFLSLTSPAQCGPVSTPQRAGCTRQTASRPCCP